MNVHFAFEFLNGRSVLIIRLSICVIISSFQKGILGDNLHIQGTFCDSHDVPRFLCESTSWANLKNYLVLTLTMEVLAIFHEI